MDWEANQLEKKRAHPILLEAVSDARGFIRLDSLRLT